MNSSLNNYWWGQLLGAQHTIYRWHISRVQRAGTAQLTLALGSHLSEDVAFESVFVLVTASSLFEPLSSTAMYFSFWHLSSPKSGLNPECYFQNQLGS
ncbi:hypothetical protein TERTU_1457 [Teredinibacter turnerae T7901]|uniref:Uncharacterized protein n=1 Tax=Teredinibacter turnerae (strain ATCC 39867 / T7901) TaxID=377629 RepID=C5BSQ4_TERTT|nr:hypothetical protein TERTU_1457 [Teredinibacter turnerae T7901]